MGFTGFSNDSLRFLFENKMNNSKEWYDSHKDEYKRFVYKPFEELIKELAPVITEIDSSLITVPSKLISRVRRDTRFSKDKSLYRDNAWLTFLRDKSQMATSPCFWFDINQKGSSYGVGYYGAETGSMERMREMIISRHPAFVNALTFYESQDKFTIGGEQYKKNRYPEQPSNICQWLNRKNIYFECTQNELNIAFSKELPDILKNDYKNLKPIYDFFCAVESSI